MAAYAHWLALTVCLQAVLLVLIIYRLGTLTRRIERLEAHDRPQGRGQGD